MALNGSFLRAQYHVRGDAALLSRLCSGKGALQAKSLLWYQMQA